MNPRLRQGHAARGGALVVALALMTALLAASSVLVCSAAGALLGLALAAAGRHD